MRRLAMIFLSAVAANASAQENCLEPFRPDEEFLVDGGYDAKEMRDEFRTYFSEVETYLNCLNRSSARIRQDATAAAQDYSRILDHYPVEAGPGVEPEIIPRVGLSESGTLFLEYDAEWLR